MVEVSNKASLVHPNRAKVEVSGGSRRIQYTTVISNIQQLMQVLQFRAKAYNRMRVMVCAGIPLQLPHTP